MLKTIKCIKTGALALGILICATHNAEAYTNEDFTQLEELGRRLEKAEAGVFAPKNFKEYQSKTKRDTSSRFMKLKRKGEFGLDFSGNNALKILGRHKTRKVRVGAELPAKVWQLYKDNVALYPWPKKGGVIELLTTPHPHPLMNTPLN